MSRTRIGPVEIIAGKPRGRLLDVPAGHGLESSRLRELGFTVAAAELFPQPNRDREIGWVQADANEPLPFHAGEVSVSVETSLTTSLLRLCLSVGDPQ